MPEEAYPVLTAERGTEGARTQRALQRLVALYEAWGRPAQAASHRDLLTEAEPS